MQFISSSFYSVIFTIERFFELLRFLLDSRRAKLHGLK